MSKPPSQLHSIDQTDPSDPNVLDVSTPDQPNAFSGWQILWAILSVIGLLRVIEFLFQHVRWV